MNFIAWDKAYCLFPAATLLSRSSLTFVDIRSKEAYSKYIKRGFKMSALPLPMSSFPDEFKSGGRWINDSQSWVIDLQPDYLLVKAGIGLKEAKTYAATENMGFTLLLKSPEGPFDSALKRNPAGTHSNYPAIYIQHLLSSVLQNGLVLPLSYNGHESDVKDPFFQIRRSLEAQENIQKDNQCSSGKWDL